ncbi:Protein FAR1-RELATED SEQUENCE 5 [Dichanthelium oligosanthes]|uniref:Protein FAR1-RELATED SEQUENCE 5 n=1 Tax=Dichanthelium oligosanthes TaxID=888268 RepID=A0A1E5VW07_9POAL|nr:Protein FAR1-RELATED SEQUENCE 5 [Dichanthelium oligosanthes]
MARHEASASAPGVDFHLPDEILAVIPTDPYEQLDVARKITSMAIASRVSRLEADAARLRRDLADRDRTEADLRARLADSDARLAAALDENVSSPVAVILPVSVQLRLALSFLPPDPRSAVEAGEGEGLACRDGQEAGEELGKEVILSLQLEAFKKQLMKSLSEDNLLQLSETSQDHDAEDNLTARVPSWKDEVSSNHSSDTSSRSTKTESTYSGGRPRIDGKEFFRQARTRLSYEQFGAFLANIKEFNAQKQSREVASISFFMVQTPCQKQKKYLEQSTKIYTFLSRICLIAISHEHLSEAVFFSPSLNQAGLSYTGKKLKSKRGKDKYMNTVTNRRVLRRPPESRSHHWSARPTTMANPSTSGDPAAAGEPVPTPAPSQVPAQRRHPTSRISHIVRTYLDLSSSKKRRAAPKSQPKAGSQETHGAEDGTDGTREAPPVSHPSRLLRELGIRVSRYTNEERRDIILRYMQKRSDRQVVNRAASKVPSRQALAERRLRGAGGKFLSKNAQNADDPEGKEEEEEPELPPEVVSNAGGVPIVGMVFESEEKAYEYYVSYAGNMGFSVRKGWWDKTAKNSNRSREFVDTWNMIMEKYNLRENELLIKLYEDRENWAVPYNLQIFSGDIKSMLQAENVGTRLKEYLGCDTDLSPLLKFFESSAEKRRQEEMQADYHANQGVPRIPLPLLWQAANLYTPITFDLFKKECEQSMDCMAYGCGEFGSLSEYMIAVKNKTKDQLVRFDSSNGTVACTCKKFENAGLLCCHILKVYELRNVKEIPPQYFLKRWRKDAKLLTMDEADGFNFDSDTKSSVPGRYAALCRLFYNIAAKAAENVDSFALMASQSDQLLAEVEGMLRSTLDDKSSGPSFMDQLTHMAQNDYLLNSSHEALGSTGKKKCEIARRRNDLETNKRKKARKGQPDETEGGPSGELNITPGSIQTEPRNTSNQFIPDQLMQGHYVLGHNFGLGISQNLNDNLNQFGQASSVSTLQQQPFPGNGQLTQVSPTDDCN